MIRSRVLTVLLASFVWPILTAGAACQPPAETTTYVITPEECQEQYATLAARVPGFVCPDAPFTVQIRGSGCAQCLGSECLTFFPRGFDDCTIYELAEEDGGGFVCVPSGPGCEA